MFSGSWLNINGEAIYGSRPWKYQNDTTASHVWLVVVCVVSPPPYPTITGTQLVVMVTMCMLYWWSGLRMGQ